ncbi:hypothetical protein ACGFMK_28285 [Amycolatopsis sp. NPDC049252]|uniref:hypothetical protein n=1 Tax=Amycolatopsis sp. NPDC049252 TaxID=3363933 RepID=UPI0037225608
MAWDNMLAVGIFMGLVGLVILMLLWPNDKRGARLLVRWGVPDPDEAEVALAVRYLKRRRFWYPWLYLALPLLFGGDNNGAAVLGTLLLGGLIAELLAQRPARGHRREAVLVRRTLRDVVPVWALVLSGLASVAAIVHLVPTRQWTLLAVAAGTTVVCWAITLLAVRRPPTGEPRADLALRCRSARVAIGLGIATCTAVGWTEGTLAALLITVAGIAAFLAVTAPLKRLPAPA